MSQYTLKDFEPVDVPDEWTCPSCSDYTAVRYRSIEQHYRHCSDDDEHFLVAYFDTRLKATYLSGAGRNAIADRLGICRQTISAALDSLDVRLRTQSEAVTAWYENLDNDKREAALYGGQDKAAEVLEKWREENPEHHLSNSLSNLPYLGHGPDHPDWEGGKNLRDALKLTYGKDSWANIRERERERAGRACELCGDLASECRVLDVHHIIPILAGGSNHSDNLMPLCRSCHATVEQYTKRVIDLEPVFDPESLHQ